MTLYECKDCGFAIAGSEPTDAHDAFELRMDIEAHEEMHRNQDGAATGAHAEILDQINWDRAATASEPFGLGDHLRESVADILDQLYELGLAVVKRDVPQPSFAEMATRLDRHAIDLAEKDDYEGARLVVETAEAFTRRQLQLEAGDFR